MRLWKLLLGCLPRGRRLRGGIMEVLDDFVNEFRDLLKKYSIDGVDLVNLDNNERGHHQLFKLSKTSKGTTLVMGFSGNGDTLCPCCAEKEGGRHVRLDQEV